MAEGIFASAFDLDFALRMGAALAVGALIGLERERHREARTVLAGIRTYPLVALAGVLFTEIGITLEGDYYIAVGAAVFGGFALMLYHVRHQLGLHGLTSPIALFVTYLVGTLIGLGFLLEGILSGVATAVLLFTKARLHHLAEVMSEKEMAGALQFVIVAFILYPLFSGAPVDPWGVVDPKRLILIVVFVSGLSFASFLVMRTLGARRGLAVSGLLGGLVNSEATTASLANLAKEKPQLELHAIEGITLTNATMLLRNMAIAAFVDPGLELLGAIAPALIGMFLVQSAFALRSTRPGQAEGETIRVGNPFAVKPAIRFALIFLGLLVVTALIERLEVAGEHGVMLTAIGGLVSSAAVVASVGTLLVDGRIGLATAAITAVAATIISTLNKLILTRSIHKGIEPRIRMRFGVPAAAGVVLLATSLAWL